MKVYFTILYILILIYSNILSELLVIANYYIILESQGIVKNDFLIKFCYFDIGIYSPLHKV